MKGYRIANRYRFITFVVLTIILFTMAFNFMFELSTAQSETIREYRTIAIYDGDTLWDIAEDYMPDTETGVAVYELCELNNISAAELQAGMTIQVPISL